eukprot:7011476-Ditylum_brightwellii.AAC.1
MTINALSIDKIDKAFPHPVLPRFVGQLTYKNLYELHKLLIISVSAIQSTIGGGKFEYLGLLIEAPKYLQLTRVAFAVLPNPVM